MSQRLVTICTLATIVLAPAALAAQAKFEGTVTAHLVAAQGGTDATYFIKGTQFRMEITAGNGMSMYLLKQNADAPAMMVMPAQRMYMEMPAAQAAAAQSAAEHKTTDVKATGKKETIAGVECEHFLITSDEGGQYDACLAKGLGTFMMAGNPMGRGRGTTPGPWSKLTADAFPLRVQEVGKALTFEVTKIEKKSLGDDLFKVPDGFQKMSMPGRP